MPEVWVVYGSIRMAPLMRVGRNMVVCRQGDELTLLNPVRLDRAGGGRNSNGSAPSRISSGSAVFTAWTTAYYIARFGAKFWCQAGSTHYPEPPPDVVTRTTTRQLPIDGARVMTYSNETRQPECVVLIERDGGLLVTCDSLQNYTEMKRHLARSPGSS